MKKIIIYICIVISFVIIGGMTIVYRTQYNWNGVSRYLCIEIDDSGWKEIWQNDNEKVLTYNLIMPYLTSVNAKTIDLDKALRQKKIQPKDLYQNANESEEITLNGKNASVYFYENYKVILSGDEIIIAAKDADIERR